MATTTTSSTSTEEFKGAIRTLLERIEAQEGFAAQQGARRGKLYFMWDFISSTLRMVDGPREAQSDAVQRCFFARVLLTDTTGKLTMMKGGDATAFNADIKDQAKVVETRASAWEQATRGAAAA